MNHQKGLVDVGCPELSVFSRPSLCLLGAGVVHWGASASASAGARPVTVPRGPPAGPGWP